MIKETIEKNAEVKVNSKEMEVLQKHFPSCFDKDGKFDIKVFEELIKTEDVDIKKEGYSLDFLGKSYARYLASLDSETVIVPDEGNKDINSENIYIVGDNLDALQHLKYSYSERIKCIYIDPPYNTGSDGFVYNDKFEFTAEELAKKIGIEQEEAERVLNMQGKSTHSAWLTFMYPRLELARDLLKEDGVIFISIDDNECHNLKLLCDNIFGESNFIAEFPRITKRGGKSSEVIAKNHDYVLVYSKTNQPQLYPLEHNDSAFKHKDEYFDERGFYKLNQTLDYDSLQYSKTLDYPIELNGETFYPGSSKELYDERQAGIHDTADWAWRWSKEKFKFGYDNGFIVIKKSRNGSRIYTKTYQKATIEDGDDGYYIDYGDRTKSLSTLETTENLYSNDNATKDIANTVGKKVFDHTKPISLMKLFMSLCTNGEEIIMDFFSGSASTAEAVMQQNLVDDKKRRFIMVQFPEVCDKNKAAYKQGYKTIDEIGRERIRRAAKKIAEENPEKAESLDLGFKTYYLKSTDKQTLDKIVDFDPNMPLDAEDIKSKFGKDTIIETWKIKDGYGFNAEVKEIDLKGYTAYLLTDSKVGTSLYLIDDMPDNAIVELVRKIEAYELNVDRIIEYGYAFSHATNTALRSNLKTLKNRNAIEPIIRY